MALLRSQHISRPPRDTLLTAETLLVTLAHIQAEGTGITSARHVLARLIVPFPLARTLLLSLETPLVPPHRALVMRECASNAIVCLSSVEKRK